MGVRKSPIASSDIKEVLYGAMGFVNDATSILTQTHNTFATMIHVKTIYRVGQKTGLFLEVCNSRIC